MVSAVRATCYVGAILLLGVTLLAGVGVAVVQVTSVGGVPGAALAALAVILAAPLTIWLARDLVHLVLYAFLPAPSPMAELELDLDGEFPAPLATCVVYPVIVHEEADVDALLATMLATREDGGSGPAAHLALVDFSDSPTRHRECDAVLRRELEARIAAANAAGAASPPLAALFRDRRWNPAERTWMGWERKRGKLMEFIELVSGGLAATSFAVDRPEDRALTQRLQGLRYVLTLDVGSRLCHGGVRRMVATAAHPDNAAVIDEPSETVVSGYGVLRPHQALHPTRTAFGWVMYSGPDVKPVPSVGQQLLDHDVFFGQGLIDVAAVRATMHRRVPENSVLSHDKLEGLHTGAACQTDVVLVDQTPPDYLTFRRRYHRWIRGDFHLVPWIFRRGSGPGAAGRRSLSLLGRWLLMEDLFGHSHSVSAVAMLVLGWLVAPAGQVGTWTFVVLLLLVESVATEPLTFLVRRRAPAADHAGRPAVVIRALSAESVRWALWVVLLADRALLTLDAAGRALYRTLVSRRHVLQWTSFAHTSRGAGTGLRDWWRQLWLGPATAVTTAALVVMINPVALPWAAPLLALWSVAPAVAWWISRPQNAA